MAILSDSEREILWGLFMRQPEPGENMGLAKSDLRNAVNALDDWMNANETLINLAIPQPARSSLSSQQKARLLTYVVQRRFEAG